MKILLDLIMLPNHMLPHHPTLTYQNMQLVPKYSPTITPPIVEDSHNVKSFLLDAQELMLEEQQS